MSESVIEIDCMPLNIVAASSADRVERMSRRIRDAIARAVPSAVASTCGGELDADTSIVFIDRLEVQCSVAADWSEDAVAKVFAGQLVRALVGERSLGQPLTFRDRAEFLAAFFAAAIEGHAFSRWWLSEFEGLSVLPISACIRTLSATEGVLAWESLSRLSPDCQYRVVSALVESDADRMLAGVSRYPSGRLAPTRVLMSAIDAAMAMPFSTRSHRLIAALIRFAHEDATSVCAKNLAALGAIDRLFDAARRGLLSDLPHDTETAMMATWWHAAGIDTSDIAIAIELDVSPLVERVQTMRSRLPQPAEDLFDVTPFGGALVLAVVLVRTGWWRAWRDALVADFGERANSVAAWLALAVTARAMNSRHRAAIEFDSALRRVFGVPDERWSPASGRTDKRALATALAAADPAISEGALRQLGAQLLCWSNALLIECGRRIPGCDGASPSYLRTQCLSFPAAVATDGSAARLGRPPLDVLLMLSGLKRAHVTLPDGRTLALAEGMDS